MYWLKILYFFQVFLSVIYDKRKMWRKFAMNIYLFIVFASLCLHLTACRADNIFDESSEDAIENDVDKIQQADIEKYIRIFEDTALLTRKPDVEDVLPAENTNEVYDEMAASVQDLIDLNTNFNNLYVFLRAKGLDRIIAPNLKISYTPLRRQLLLLTKQLLEIAPTATKALIPIAILDNVLDIFENDQNLSIKAYALDVLHLWLPGNPKIQARVMKLKGLDPFYHQISNLDVTVIHTLLQLFNKILDEHIDARSAQKTRENAEDLLLYQRIGLLQRMSTSHVCNGLLNIFETSLPFISSTGQIISSMFELVKKVKPFCMNVYKGKSKAIEVFRELFQFVSNPDNEEKFVKNDVNFTDVYEVLEKYVQELRYVVAKDEL